MKKFGVVKTKILNKLIESYSKENKGEIKKLLSIVNENKDFKEMYLFYEEFENKHIEDKETAKLYVEEVESLFKKTKDKVFVFCESIDNNLNNVNSETNKLYESLDTLFEENTLSNIERKVNAKKSLVEHLITKKQTEQKQNGPLVTNESLLHAVLTNNFNVLYSNTLSEQEKKDLKDILILSNEDLTNKTNDLKESLYSQIDSLLNESADDEVKTKLNRVKEEIKNKDTSRISYYKLLELKNGLI